MTSPSSTFPCSCQAQRGLGSSNSSPAASAAGETSALSSSGTFQGTCTRPENTWDLRNCRQRTNKTLWEYIQHLILQEAQRAPQHHRRRRDQRLHLRHILRGSCPHAQPWDPAHNAGAPRCHYPVCHRQGGCPVQLQRQSQDRRPPQWWRRR